MRISRWRVISGVAIPLTWGARDFGPDGCVVTACWGNMGWAMKPGEGGWSLAGGWRLREWKLEGERTNRFERDGFMGRKILSPDWLSDWRRKSVSIIWHVNGAKRMKS